MDNKFCKTGILLLVVILNTVLVSAQSFNFLNYNEAQVMYNPAMLSSVSRTQIALNYRNNKLTEGVNYYSTMLGFQMPLGLYTEKLNLGTFCISAFDDRINYAPSVNKTGVALAYSQPVRLSTYSFLSIGMQCNIYQKRLDIGQFTTGNQWSANLGFDPSFTNGEEQFNDKINLYTLNSGVYWQLNGNNSKPKAFAGASVFNINKPDESFIGKGNKQQWRYFFHGGYTLADNRLGNIVADVIWLGQQKQNIAGLGLKTGLYYGTSTSGMGELAVSARFLTNNTLMMGATVDQNRFVLGFSYDFLTVKPLNSGSRSGAIELFLKFRMGRSGKKAVSVSTPVSTYQSGQKRVFAEERKTEVIESSTPNETTLKKVEEVSDTASSAYEPMRLALKRDFKFAFNDAKLNDEAKKYLDELAVLMQRNKKVTLEIIGHTDDVGSKEGNQKISVQRAQIVADYLESKGIDKNRLTVTGKMDSEPLFPNTSPENRAKNRRVEFIILN